ncbi:LLM class flavin-dependent oxidoreductase, partial [Streptomyces sp. SID9727]|uniref:LLM class flavin-dependent oxidoreductase n=1 Tax=Streptomyces sp. SID9727 TaxID=2706114 RepID=UPI0013C5AF77
MPARTPAPRPAALRPLHLAAEIGGPPRYDAAHHTGLARLAEGGALDFVTLGDSFARPGPDALAVLARVAPATRRIGLVPTLTATHTEPSRLASAVATLDWVSRGRAGWRVGVSAAEAEARLFGRRPAASADALWDGAGKYAEVCARRRHHWEPPQGRPVVVVDGTPGPA